MHIGVEGFTEDELELTTKSGLNRWYATTEMDLSTMLDGAGG